ncbi:MAG: hypothetical protein MHPSP_002314, partial [Paramarteilia canceri]
MGLGDIFKSSSFPYEDEEFRTVEDFINESSMKTHLKIINSTKVDTDLNTIKLSISPGAQITDSNFDFAQNELKPRFGANRSFIKNLSGQNGSFSANESLNDNNYPLL